MGREKIRFPSKRDYHLDKDGLRNWWEGEHHPSKKRERQHSRIEIERDELDAEEE